MREKWSIIAITLQATFLNKKPREKLAKKNIFEKIRDIWRRFDSVLPKELRDIRNKSRRRTMMEMTDPVCEIAT